MPYSKWLACLQNLLENLPESIPRHDLKSSHYSFSVAAEEVEEYGDEASAFNHRTTTTVTIESPRSRTDFELDDDIDLTLLFLCNMVSDERPAPDPMGLATAGIVAAPLGTNRNATAEEWETM